MSPDLSKSGGRRSSGEQAGCFGKTANESVCLQHGEREGGRVEEWKTGTILFRVFWSIDFMKPLEFSMWYLWRVEVIGVAEVLVILLNNHNHSDCWIKYQEGKDRSRKNS